MLECCGDCKILSLLLKHERGVLEHYRIEMTLESYDIDAVDLLCKLEERVLERECPLLEDFLALLLEGLVVLDEFHDCSCKVRCVVEQ